MLASKVFTFTPDYDYRLLDAREVIKGGTGYEVLDNNFFANPQ